MATASVSGTRCRQFFRWVWRKLTNSTNTRSWRVNFRECDVHRLMVSFWSCVGYVGLGAALVIFGPTILDLGDQLNISVSILSIMLGCRAVGAAIGSVGSGLTVDKLVNYSYIFMSFILLFCVATTVMIPLSVNVYMLAVFMFLNGVATGGLDSGTHAVLMRLWKQDSGPCMQVLHFAFAFGAFIAPLIARQFISAEQGASNSTDLSGSGGTSSGDCAVMGCDSNTTETGSDGDFRIAYYISSSIFLPTLFAFIFYAFRYEVVRCCMRNTHDQSQTAIINEDELEENGDMLGNDSTTDEAPRLIFSENTQDSIDADVDSSGDLRNSVSQKTKQPLWFVVCILFLLGVFMFFYVGLEVAYGNWIFTVVVTGSLDFSKSMGTVIQSLFWGTFAFTRLFSVLLAVLNVKSSVMITGNLTGSVIASVIMVSSPHNATAIWLASAVLGMSYASIYPTVMTWMSETIEPTGKATSVLVTGGVLGDITIPAAVGAIVDRVSPESLFYATFVGVILCAVFVTLLFTLAYLQKRRQGEVPGTTQRLTSLRTNGHSEHSDEEVKLMNSEQSISVGDNEDATSL